MAEAELIGTATVKLALSASDYLKPFISENDRSPSFDGFICGYSNKKKSKKSEKGRAPVQIKGKETKPGQVLQEQISYSVNVSDLMAFMREGGALFFVVLFDKENPEHKRIYYKPLLPYDLNGLIDGKEQQETISIHLKPFPKGREMEDAILTFIDNRNKQFSIVSATKYRNYTLEEIMRSRGFSKPLSLNVGYTTVQNKKYDIPCKYFFEHDFYLYYKDDPFDTLIPTQHIDHMEIVHTDVFCSFVVNGDTYFNRCSVTILKDRVIYGFYLKNDSKADFKEKKRTDIVIQDVNEDWNSIKPIKLPKDIQKATDIHAFPFTVVVLDEKDDRGRSKATYTYTVTGTLNERINTNRFVIDLFEQKEYSINGSRAAWNPPKAELQKINFQERKDELSYLQVIRETLDAVGCNEDLELNDFTDLDRNRLKCLVGSVKCGHTVGFNNPIPDIGVYQVGNLHLFLFFEKQEDGRYLMKRFPGKLADCHTEDDEGNIHPTSIYTIFTDSDYERLSNIDYDEVVKSITSYEDIAHYDRATFSVLYMLLAYDKTGRIELLNSAAIIASWLVREDIVDNTISTLNVYQCQKRIRELSSDEKQSIRELLSMNEEKTENLAGCYLLLDESEKAAKCIESMESNVRETFLKYPIMKFMDPEVRKKL